MTEINQDWYRTSTYQVGKDDSLYGVGSKQYKIYCNSINANPILDVQPNMPTSEWEKTAVIENLVIDGQSFATTGIRLRDVCNCLIRNVTIKNCDVGINLDISAAGRWTESNRIEHVRMSGVKQGILFSTTTGGGGSFGFTKIDDVGIELKNDNSAVGIQIGSGTSLVQPYSSFIKANVWIQSAGGTGLKIMNGELKYGLINLAVQGPSNGIGVDLQSDPTKDRVIWYNQFSTFTGNDTVDKPGFLLATGGITYAPPENDHRILPRGTLTDILTKSW